VANTANGVGAAELDAGDAYEWLYAPHRKLILTFAKPHTKGNAKL
jgi:hypothetical protein